MPGLIRGVARTAVVAGTATAVSNNVSRRQAARYADQNQPVQPEAAAPAADDQYVQLQKLATLRDDGILTQEEFDAKKREILGL